MLSLELDLTLLFPVGKTLAYTTVTFYNDKGEMTARGSHTK
jgi:hypothetical protein